MAVLQGRLGFLSQNFDAGQDLLAVGGAIDAQTPESTKCVINHLGIVAEPGTKVTINGIQMVVGKSHIIELDNEVAIKSLIFPEGGEAEITYIY